MYNVLIQKTVYFREEDVELWEAVKNKAEFLHNALAAKPIVDLGLGKPTESPRVTSSSISGFCKHGADPKMCKFAKNGKACK